MPTATVLVNTAQFLGPQATRGIASKVSGGLTVVSTTYDLYRCGREGYGLYQDEKSAEMEHKKYLKGFDKMTIETISRIGTIEAYEILKIRVKEQLRSEFWKHYPAKNYDQSDRLLKFFDLQDRMRYADEIEDYLQWKVDGDSSYSPFGKVIKTRSCIR